MNTSSQLRLAFVALLFTTVSFATQAQKEQPVAKDGFWVVESTPQSRLSIVRFYTNEWKMIYEETVDRKLNSTRRQTRQQLNVALEQALFVWNATHQIPTDRQWVSVRFGKK